MKRDLKRFCPKKCCKRAPRCPEALFIGSSERNFVLLRLDAPEDRRYHAIYHEYVHQVMRLNFPDLPLWLNEGLAEFFALRQMSGTDTSDLGNPQPGIAADASNRHDASVGRAPGNHARLAVLPPAGHGGDFLCAVMGPDALFHDRRQTGPSRRSSLNFWDCCRMTFPKRRLSNVRLAI